MTSSINFPMRKRTIAIIGAGLAGASAALAFQEAGFQVTLWSDKSREELRDHVPATGTAVLFGESRAVDTHIIEDLYPTAPPSSGMSVHIVSGQPGQVETLLRFDAQFAYQAQAVDVRLRADDRIEKFLQLDGTFQVQNIDIPLLEEIASEHDLTLIATGKNGLADLFEIDSDRTVYAEPQRYLLTVTAQGLGHGSDTFSARSIEGGAHNMFSGHPDLGEFWWGPYYHKDIGPSWSFVGFANRGSELEAAFRAVDSAQSALTTIQEYHRKYFPEISADLDKLEVIPHDPHAWIKGAVLPVVKKPYAYTPQGNLVAALGDTAIAVDPIAGQGAQLAITQVAYLVEAAQQYHWKYDAQWINDQFERHWLKRGRGAVETTRLFLADPDYTEFSSQLFAAASQDPAVATGLFQLLSEPQGIVGLGTDDEIAQFIDDSRDIFTGFIHASSDGTTENVWQKSSHHSNDNSSELPLINNSLKSENIPAH